MSGLVNQVPVEGIGNMNFTSLMEVMFKGSAYVLCGELPHRFGTNEHMMLKIPMSAENEMESQYSISDIEIGKVTVLGIYRGEFDRRDVERKINRMMALNDSGKKNQQETIFKIAVWILRMAFEKKIKMVFEIFLLRKEKFITLMSLPLFKTSIFR